VLGNGSSRDFVPQPRQLRLDPPLAPQRVLRGHTSDEQSELTPDRVPAVVPRSSRPPTPIGFPALAVPTQHRFGLHDQQRPPPAREPAAPNDPETPIGIPQPWPRVPTLKDQQLLPEAKVLSDQRGSRFEKSGQCPRRPSKHQPLLAPVIRGRVSHLISSGGSATSNFCALHSARLHPRSRHFGCSGPDSGGRLGYQNRGEEPPESASPGAVKPGRPSCELPQRQYEPSQLRCGPSSSHRRPCPRS